MVVARLAASSMKILSTRTCYFFLNFGVNYRYKRNNFSKEGTYLEWTRLTEES